MPKLRGYGGYGCGDQHVVDHRLGLVKRAAAHTEEASYAAGAEAVGIVGEPLGPFRRPQAGLDRSGPWGITTGLNVSGGRVENGRQ